MLEVELPSEGRLLGIDFGTVRIGLAICDPSQRWVTPLDTYNRRTERLDALFFTDLLVQESIVGIVLGLPIHGDGTESQKSREVRVFQEWLGRLKDVPCVLQDERFTTAEARRLLADTGLSFAQRKKRIDRVAAHLILEHFLEARRHGPAALGGIEDGPA
jgi:putative holliday junction resolvase